MMMIVMHMNIHAACSSSFATTTTSDITLVHRLPHTVVQQHNLSHLFPVRTAHLHPILSMLIVVVVVVDDVVVIVVN